MKQNLNEPCPLGKFTFIGTVLGLVEFGESGGNVAIFLSFDAFDPGPEASGFVDEVDVQNTA